jgi:hypothetical protein
MENPSSRLPFNRFYQEVFLAEHRQPLNVALHVFGTLISAAYIVAILVYAHPAWLLLYPAIHALPGLLGHRFFERDAQVGDVRVLRKDYPAYWFIAGNHLLTLAVLTGKRPRADARA